MKVSAFLLKVGRALRARRLTFLFISLLCGLVFTALAQIPQGTRLSRSSMPSYRHTSQGNKLDFVITGSPVVNLGPQLLSVGEFEMTSFRNGDPKQTNIIAQAPQCEVDLSNNVASDPGPIKIFTPTGKLAVKGVGFVFTQTNHLLIISNQVETRVVKSMLKSPMLAQKTNAPAGPEQVLWIHSKSGRFNMDSNVVDYAGNVHLIDPQLDLTSDFLTIQFTSNGAVQSVLARQNVVLTTVSNGVATGEIGYYYLVGTNEMMRLTKNATWHNGDQSAKAQEFTYDNTRHFLTGSNRVQVRWPNQPQKPPGGAAPVQMGTNGFREMFADFATLQFPPTNGPVKSMHARGNVIIINDADQSKAMAGQADYERITDRVDLTIEPVWWNTNVEVKADLLSAELGTKTYFARTNAHFKMRTGSGPGGTNQSLAASGHSTNKWVFIASDSIEYQTNQALFLDHVKTQVVDNEQLQDTLDCGYLLLTLTNNKLQTAFATGKVYGETAPDTNGMIKTITCRELTAELSVTTGYLKTVDAQTNVVIKEIGSGTNNLCNTLTADSVTAQFSAVTNEIERAVADRNVVLNQFKAGKTIHATAAHGVYTAAVDQVKLTGTPVGRSDTDLITDSDLMIWQPKANNIRAFGRYKIAPIKKAVTQKSL